MLSPRLPPERGEVLVSRLSGVNICIMHERVAVLKRDNSVR